MNKKEKSKLIKDIMYQYEYMVKEYSLGSFIETVADKISNLIKDDNKQ
jgi:hypothetical protein